MIGPFRALSWQDGTRSAAEGEDLAGVARGLSTDDLLFWIRVFGRRPLCHEQRILEAELDRRGRDLGVGPLFRGGPHGS